MAHPNEDQATIAGPDSIPVASHKSERESMAAGNRSLRRGLTVLDCVGRHGAQGVRVVDLMRQCGLERATVYRLLDTLIEERYVVMLDRFKYGPGPRFKSFRASPPVDQLTARLLPVLKQVSEIMCDSSFAIVREGTQSHCIARQIGSFPVQVLAVQVGRRQPLGVGAAGLALLASLDESEACSIIEANASSLHAYHGLTPARLLLLTKATRQRGWSVVGNHVAPDVIGVGLAVQTAGTATVAAISVAAPANRLPSPRQLVAIRTIREALSRFLPDGV